MYIDGVIIFSLIVIAMICAMMGYILWYAYRHIKHDIQRFKAKQADKLKLNDKRQRLDGLL